MDVKLMMMMSSEQATNICVSLFTKQYNLVIHVIQNNILWHNMLNVIQKYVEKKIQPIMWLATTQ